MNQKWCHEAAPISNPYLGSYAVVKLLLATAQLDKHANLIIIVRDFGIALSSMLAPVVALSKWVVRAGSPLPPLPGSLRGCGRRFEST